MKRIAQRLDLKRRELEGWQRDSGIGLCRLDFRKNSLVSVEAFPLFEEEQEITTRQVASAVAGIFV